MEYQRTAALFAKRQLDSERFDWPKKPATNMS